MYKLASNKGNLLSLSTAFFVTLEERQLGDEHLCSHLLLVHAVHT